MSKSKNFSLRFLASGLFPGATEDSILAQVKLAELKNAEMTVRIFSEESHSTLPDKLLIDVLLLDSDLTEDEVRNFEGFLKERIHGLSEVVRVKSHQPVVF